METETRLSMGAVSWSPHDPGQRPESGGWIQVRATLVIRLPTHVTVIQALHLKQGGAVI